MGIVTIEGRIEQREADDFTQGSVWVIDSNGEETSVSRDLSWINGHSVNMRWWSSETRLTKDQAIEAVVTTAMGISEVESHACYSEITGYLYYAENFTIGGHDVLEELGCIPSGHWVIIEVEYDGEQVTP